MTVLLRRRLDALALDVGRLRRRLDAESYDGFLVWRIAEQVEGLDALIGPTAAEVLRDRPLAGVDDALKTVDERVHTLRTLLGGDPR